MSTKHKGLRRRIERQLVTLAENPNVLYLYCANKRYIRLAIIRTRFGVKL